jgi:hypothetical protein
MQGGIEVIEASSKPRRLIASSPKFPHSWETVGKVPYRAQTGNLMVGLNSTESNGERGYA